MSINVTRRALLATAPAVAALASAPAVSTAIMPSSELDAAMAACRRAEALCDRWHVVFYDPAYATFAAQRDALPHFTTEMAREHLLFSTSDISQVQVARNIIRSRHGERRSELTDRCQELVEAADKREGRIQALKDEHRIEELNARSDQLSDAKVHAFWDVRNAPVSTPADMLRKIEFLKQTIDRQGYDDEELWGDWVLGDIKRIAGEKA